MQVFGSGAPAEASRWCPLKTLLHQDRKGREAAEHGEGRIRGMSDGRPLASVLRWALHEKELSRKTGLAFFAILV
jgi:hypothetical protein